MVDWLVGWWGGWLVGCLVGRLVGWVVGSSIGWLGGRDVVSNGFGASLVVRLDALRVCRLKSCT